MLPTNGTATAVAPIAPVQAVAVIKKLRFSWSTWLGAEKDKALLFSVLVSDMHFPYSLFETKFSKIL
jgi:hypothetical protein